MSHDPIAYTALSPGTPVLSTDGASFGRVEAVLVVEEVDVFDGIVVATDAGLRFVDADHVGQIFTDEVHTTLTAEAAAALPEPDGTPVYGVDAGEDTGSSIGDRLGRMFGRGRWKQQ